ncbi:hypothetical protein D3C80_1244420 [compost metagenome]
MVDVGLGDHGSHGRGHVTGVELVTDVLFPEGGEVVVGADGPPQRSDAALMGQQRSRLVEVVPLRTGEGMVDARIDIQLDAGHTSQPLDDDGTGLGRTEHIQLGEVQHQAAALQVFRLRQGVLDADAVVAHGAGHLRQPATRQVGQLAAQAIAHDADPCASAFVQPLQGPNAGLNILDPEPFIETFVEGKSPRKVGLGVTQLDAAHLAPVEVGYQHRVPLLGQQVSHLTHGLVDAEDFLAQHKTRPTAVYRDRQIGLKLFSGCNRDIYITAFHELPPRVVGRCESILRPRPIAIYPLTASRVRFMHKLEFLTYSEKKLSNSEKCNNQKTIKHTHLG